MNYRRLVAGLHKKAQFEGERETDPAPVADVS